MGVCRSWPGGEVHYSEHGPAPGLIGPPGWLPDLESGALLGLQLRSGRLAVVPLDEVLRLPHEVGPAEWSRHLLDAADDGETLTLAGVPRSLLSELRGRAARMNITVSEYVVLQLGAHAWRWQPPCVHELERQRAEAEHDRRAAVQARSDHEMLYVDMYGNPVDYLDEDLR